MPPGTAARCDNIDLAADEIGGQRRQPIVVKLRPAVLDGQVLPFDIAGLTQTLSERGQQRSVRVGRSPIEVADHWNRLLLRAGSA